MVTNRWIVLSSVRLLDEFDKEEKNRCIINIFMALYHYSRVRQEFNFAKCLAYGRGCRTISHGELKCCKLFLGT